MNPVDNTHSSDSCPFDGGTHMWSPDRTTNGKRCVKCWTWRPNDPTNPYNIKHDKVVDSQDNNKGDK